MNSDKQPTGEWVRAIERKLEEWEAAHAVESPLTDLENLPKWVENVLKEIAKQQLPAVWRGGKLGEMDADTLGRLLGQQSAKMFELRRIVSAAETLSKGLSVEQQEWIKNALEGLEKNETLSAFLERTWELMPETNQFESFQTVCLDAFRLALEQDNRLEAAEFFVGYAEGFQKWKSLRGEYTDATQIYGALYFAWPEVNSLQSVSELRTFLLRNSLVTEQQLGSDPKRLQKICQRIELHFRKPGRPRKSDKPAA